MKFPGFSMAFWVRGDPTNFQPHLFYQGKEVGKINYGSDEGGRAGCEAEIEKGTQQYGDDSLHQKAKWARVVCSFPNIKGWDTTGEERNKFPGQTGAIHLIKTNPGD